MKIKYILSVGYIIHVTNDLNNDSKSIHNRFVSMVGLNKSLNFYITMHDSENQIDIYIID